MLVAQQYSYVNNERCLERVHGFQLKSKPNISVTVKTYLKDGATEGRMEKFCNVSIRDKLNPEPGDKEQNIDIRVLLSPSCLSDSTIIPISKLSLLLNFFLFFFSWRISECWRVRQEQYKNTPREKRGKLNM